MAKSLETIIGKVYIRSPSLSLFLMIEFLILHKRQPHGCLLCLNSNYSNRITPTTNAIPVISSLGTSKGLYFLLSEIIFKQSD